MKNERINILIASDINYAPYYGVMLTSLFLNNSESSFDVYLITDETWTEKETRKFEKLCIKFHSRFIVRVVEDSEIVDTFPVAGHLNRATYYNLNIANLLPESVHRVIYMDGDMIVNGDIRPLWELDMKGNVCAMALAPMWNDIDVFKRLGYNYEYGYYNNGTTLYDVDCLRSIDFSNMALECILNNGNKLEMLDQDVTNLLLHEKILRMPLKYNFQPKFLLNSCWKRYDSTFQKELIEAFQNAVIIHYSDHSKPWHFSYYGKPYARLWKVYYRSSAWRIHQQTKPLTKYCKYLLKRVLKHSAFLAGYSEDVRINMSTNPNLK